MNSVKRDIAALEAQANVLRQDALKMINQAGSGHPGGSLSAADIVTALYFGVMDIDPQNPQKADRDRFVLSKGHACPVLYAALARRGFYDVSNLDKLREFGSILQGHPDMNKTPGVDMSAGSLGNGLSVGLGMALSAKVKKQNYKVYVLLGDGELQEGMVWEAAMCAAHHHATNLTAIVDCNGLQINGSTDEIMSLTPLPDKWRSFGWNTLEVDGHSMAALLEAFDKTRDMQGPTVILAKTIKGKGVSFMENVAAWHGLAPTDEQAHQAIAELCKGGVH